MGTRGDALQGGRALVPDAGRQERPWAEAEPGRSRNHAAGAGTLRGRQAGGGRALAEMKLRSTCRAPAGQARWGNTQAALRSREGEVGISPAGLGSGEACVYGQLITHWLVRSGRLWSQEGRLGAAVLTEGLCRGVSPARWVRAEAGALLILLAFHFSVRLGLYSLSSLTFSKMCFPFTKK